MRTILITGAAAGIGLACARAFRALGDSVVLCDIDEAALERAMEGLGADALAIRMDVRDRRSIDDAFDAAKNRFDNIDVLHANAGVSSMKHALDLTDEDWDNIFDVNAKGLFLTNQIAVRHFLAQNKPGVIVNTASLAAKVGAPLLAHYSASKSAVLGWTQALAREHAKDGIRVNAVCPGFVATDMQEREIQWEAKLKNVSRESVRQDYIRQTPLGRLETPEDVAGVVTFLASDGARFMTGQGINVTGGVYMG